MATKKQFQDTVIDEIIYSIYSYRHEDYFSHPSEVRNIVRRFYPKDRVSELAALLHDSLEDAPGSTVDSPEEMEEFIRGSISDPASGDEVIRVVRALTHEKGGDYQSYVVDLMNDQPALRVKLADMVHNLSSSPSPKQKLKYKSALDAIGAQTGGQPPVGISQKHWGELQALTESKQMKITKRQLRKIIREERQRLTEQGMTPGSRALGAFAPTDQVDRIKTGLSRLYNGMINDIIAEEGLMDTEAEDMAAEGILELTREFLDSVGFGHFIK